MTSLVTFLKDSYVFLEIYMEQHTTKILKCLVSFKNIYTVISTLSNFKRSN